MESRSRESTSGRKVSTDHFSKAVVEVSWLEPQGVAANVRIVGIRRFTRGACQALGGLLAKESSGDCILHGVQRTAARECGDRKPACLSFDGDDSEVFDLRVQQDAGASIEGAQQVIIGIGDECDIAIGARSQLREATAATDDDEFLSCDLRGIDGEINTLVRLQRAGDEPEIITISASRREEIRAYRRMNDRCISSVRAPDDLGGVRGVGDELGDAARIIAIGLPQLVAEEVECTSHDG